jgi:hypothetical protein
MTGTLVHGRIANSVTTAVTRSGGVTSYVRFSGVKLPILLHFDKGHSLEQESVGMRSSGLPVQNKIHVIPRYPAAYVNSFESLNNN